MNDRRAGFAGGPAVQGSKTSEAERFPEARQEVTVLAISRDPEQQDLVHAYSGSVDRFRSACYGRPASHRLGTCQLCARRRSEVVAHPHSEWVGVPLRYGPDKVQGRQSLSRDWGCGVEAFPSRPQVAR